MKQDIGGGKRHGIKWAAFSKTGPEGCRNEDYVICDAEIGLFLVADGMGGRPGGDLASKTAAEAFAEAIRVADAQRRLDTKVLQDGINRANSAVRQQAATNQLFQGMATTITALLIAGKRGKVIHVGDSSIYLWRKKKLSRLTQDHTLVEELIKKDKIPPADAKAHPMRHVLIRSIGGESEVKAEIQDIVIRPGDRFILSTDGMRCISDNELLQILDRYLFAGPHSIAHAIWKNLRKQELSDDVSVVVLAPSYLKTLKAGFWDPKKDFKDLNPVLENLKPLPSGAWSQKQMANSKDIIVEDIEIKLRELAVAKNKIDEIEREYQSNRTKRLLELLEVMDAFERVFGNIKTKKDACTRQMNIWVGNFRTVYRLLTRVLADEGVAPIENLDQGFDPAWHEVFEKVYDPEQPSGTIVSEIRRGYVLHGKLLRRSSVVVTTEDEQVVRVTDEEQNHENENKQHP